MHRGAYRLSRIAIAIALIMGGSALVPSLAMADHVDCGAVLVKNTKLDSGLLCTGEGPALTIGAAGIRLNPAGHKVTSIGGLALLNTNAIR